MATSLDDFIATTDDGVDWLSPFMGSVETPEFKTFQASFGAWLMGGGRLASSFRSANLITESALGVIPVILGSGVPLFESRAEPNGVVPLRYRAE